MVVALAGLVGGAATAWGQHGHSGSHEEGHRAAQACATEFEHVVGAGRGFGMAFAADQNGYPGPMHVLDLKDRLKLSAEQEAKMQHLMHAMFTESKQKSARLLEAEAALRRLFAEGTADDAAVRAAVEAVERARRDVHAFFQARRPQFGGKTLEQYLEQLRIAVRLRERESAALGTYLARFA